MEVQVVEKPDHRVAAHATWQLNGHVLAGDVEGQHATDVQIDRARPESLVAEALRQRPQAKRSGAGEHASDRVFEVRHGPVDVDDDRVTYDDGVAVPVVVRGKPETLLEVLNECAVVTKHAGHELTVLVERRPAGGDFP